MQNDMRDRLVEIINKDNCLSPYMCSDKCKYSHLEHCIGDRLADRVLADGWIRPPCKVGQTVYMVTLDGKIRDITVTDVSIKVNHWETWYDILGAYMVDNIKHIIAVLPCKIGKNIFYTKDQAEQKLKELSENG